MRVLILEDDESRIKWFKSNHYGGATYVETASDCVTKLRESDWDHVFLDHDLGGVQFVDVQNENTGSAVVRWIVENVPTIGEITIHSANPPAAESMQAQLEKAGYTVRRVPFILLRQSAFAF